MCTVDVNRIGLFSHFTLFEQRGMQKVCFSEMECFSKRPFPSYSLGQVTAP